jgi:hypothetical protein
MKSVASYQSFTTFVRSRSRSNSYQALDVENAADAKNVPFLAARVLAAGSIQGGGDDRPKASMKMSWRLWMTIIAVVTGSSLQFGFGTGVMNNSEASIRADFASRGTPLTTVHWSLIVSMFGCGGLLGSLLQVGTSCNCTELLAQ